MLMSPPKPLSRGFGVQVREDLQVRAEIVIQPEEGRWVFTPNELSDLAEGLRSVLLNSKPEGGWPFRLTLKQYVGLLITDVAIPDGHDYSEWNANPLMGLSVEFRSFFRMSIESSGEIGGF